MPLEYESYLANPWFEPSVRGDHEGKGALEAMAFSYQNGSAFDRDAATTRPATGQEPHSHSVREVLPVGSKVTVRQWSGDPVLETVYAAAWKAPDCDTFLLAVLIATAKKLNLPARYGKICWTLTRLAQCKRAIT